MAEKLNLQNVEPRILSRGSVKGEDSIIKHIFERIGTTNKFCVEFGTEGHDGFHQSTTHNLRFNLGWNGIMFDGSYENLANNIHREFFTKENICERFKAHNVPQTFDFLSVDVDGNDFWLLSSLLKEFQPRVVLVEVNMRFQPNDKWVLKYNPNFHYRVGVTPGWYGCSPRLMKELGEKYGYTAVWIIFDNMVLIRNEDLHTEDVNTPWETVYPKPTPEIYDSHNDRVMNESIWMNYGENPLP